MWLWTFMSLCWVMLYSGQKEYSGIHSILRQLSLHGCFGKSHKYIIPLNQPKVYVVQFPLGFPWVQRCHQPLHHYAACLLFSRSVVFSSLRPHGLKHSRLPCPSLSPGACSNSCPLSRDAIQPSRPLSSPSLSAFNLSQHQGLFQGVISSYHVAKVLEHQHQSFQWIFSVDFS